jgi:hypothetical protein
VHEFSGVKDAGIAFPTLGHRRIAVELVDIRKEQITRLYIEGDAELGHDEIRARETCRGW